MPGRAAGGAPAERADFSRELWGRNALPYCPNCSIEVAIDAPECPNCRALLGAAAGWQPTPQPGGPVELRSPSGTTPENDGGNVGVLGAIPWLCGLVLNGFVVFLWFVFGSTAFADQRQGFNAFIWLSVLGTAIPVVGSIRLLAQGRFVAAFFATFLMVPTAAALTYLFG